MIIQGANEPIILNVKKDLTDIQDFSAVLYSEKSLIKGTGAVVLKKWTKDDVTIDAYENEVTPITLPLKESETMGFVKGNAKLEIKWLLEGNIWFAEEAVILVKEWNDKTRMTDE